MKRVTLAIACAIAYRKIPTARNLTDLACLLLATNVFSRPENRYRTSRLKVLIKYYSALLCSLYWLSPTREFVSFFTQCYSVVKHHLLQSRRTAPPGWLSKIKLLKVQKQYPVLSCQYPVNALQLQAGFLLVFFRFGSS